MSPRDSSRSLYLSLTHKRISIHLWDPERLTETLRGHLENPESLLPLDAGVSFLLLPVKDPTCAELTESMTRLCVQCNVVFDLNDVGASRAYAMDEVERQSGVEPNR